MKKIYKFFVIIITLAILACVMPMLTIAVNEVEITVNFPGVSGVTVQYNATGTWITVDSALDDTFSFTIPEDDWLAFGDNSIRVIKGGMQYLRVYPYPNTLVTPITINIPVVPITVTGIGFDCNLAITQSNWVYPSAPFTAGSAVFNVFDNGTPYELQIIKTGFSTVRLTGLSAGATADISNYFGVLEIPDAKGLRGIRLQSNGWIRSSGVIGGEFIDLLINDPLGTKSGTIERAYTAFNKPFNLDGSNPFYGSIILSFPGLPYGITPAAANPPGMVVEYSSDGGGNWNTVGNLNYDFCVFYPQLDDPGYTPGAVNEYCFRLTYGDMIYTTDITAPYTEPPSNDWEIVEISIATITVTGLGSGYQLGLGIDPSGSVYALQTRNGGAIYNVAANGDTYLVKVGKAGFNTLSLPVDVEKDVETDYPVDLSSYFYAITVPAGYSNGVIQLNGSDIINFDAGDTLLLLKNMQGVSMTYDYYGTQGNKSFVFDGSNPFAAPLVFVDAYIPSALFVPEAAVNQANLRITYSGSSVTNIYDVTITATGPLQAYDDLASGTKKWAALTLEFINSLYGDSFNGGTPWTAAEVAANSVTGENELLVVFDTGAYNGVKTFTLSDGTTTLTFNITFVDYSPPTNNTRVPSTTIKDEDPPLAEIHTPYIYGYNDGTVRPDGTITRAEVATIMWRLLPDSLQAGSGSDLFSDITANAWYAEAVNCLAGMGILKGYKDGSFKPNAPISREEFTAVLCRFFEAELIDGDNPYSDVAGWAYSYIVADAELGWLIGYNDGTFRPKAFITRAEAVTAINSILDRKVLAEDIPVEYHAIYSDLSEGHLAFQDILEASVIHSYTIGNAGTEIWQQVGTEAVNTA